MGATEGLTNLLFSYLMNPSRELSGGVVEGVNLVLNARKAWKTINKDSMQKADKRQSGGIFL